jgi:hypothetical protein
VQVGTARVGRALVVVVPLLVVATFVSQVVKTQVGVRSLTRFFDSDEKLNLPSVYKELTLLASALVTWAIAGSAGRAGDAWARHWRWLAVVMSVLALDEAITLHQSVDTVLRDHFDLSGPLHYAWVVVYLPAAAVAVACLARFWWSRPEGLRRSLALGGLLFGGGSGAFELVKGVVATDEGEHTLTFGLWAALSDSLEMIGLAILLLALLGELERRTRVVSLVLGGGPGDPAERARSRPD